MVWLRTDDTLPDERMTRRLAALLKIPAAFAVGLIISLRLRVVRFDPSGFVTDCSEAEIADFAGWKSADVPIIPPMIEAGVITRHGGKTTTLKLSDWERCVSGLKKNVADRERQTVARQSRDHNATVARTGPTTPDLPTNEGGTRPPPVTASPGGPAPDGAENGVLKLLDDAACPTGRESQRRYVRGWIASHGIEYVIWALTQPAAKGRDVIQLAREFFDEKHKPPPRPPEPPCANCESRRWVYVKDVRDPSGQKECMAPCPKCRPETKKGD
jgi:hypothetical protein